jgi:hypothetical protein
MFSNQLGIVVKSIMDDKGNYHLFSFVESIMNGCLSGNGECGDGRVDANKMKMFDFTPGWDEYHTIYRIMNTRTGADDNLHDMFELHYLELLKFKKNYGGGPDVR